jgi:hypothetical protein
VTATPPASRKPKGETKRDRFKRLAAARTSAVLRKLKVLGNCANSAGYEYTPEEVRRIFGAIESKVKEIRAKFSDSAIGDEFRL